MQTRVTDAATVGAATPEGGRVLPSRVSWGAVFAGGITAVAVGTMLNVLGLAVGATTVDPATPGGTPAASTLGIGAGVWLLVSNLIGLAVGGYVAARLSGTSDDTDGVLHGLSVWAIGFLLSAVLLGNIIAGTANTAFQGISSIIGGAARGAGQAAAAAADRVQLNPQALVERAQNALRSGGDPAQMSSEQRNAEIGRLLTQRVTTGNLAQPERDRLAQIVAAEYSIPPDQAQQRFQQVEQQAQQAAREAERRAREAADAAATATAAAAWWVFAAMLLGAGAAVFGARIGTRNAVSLSTRLTRA